ncbi:MAG: endo-1,4-beta-xylanase [Kiritimatiellae bacterium]|jgi:endo-1,4-beta-xylanase|nr:endo-1,4-beta-xylanase [Kiritimatiellia bacterium]
MNEFAKGLLKDFVFDDEINSRIEAGIEQNRKGFGKIILTDANGDAVEGATIKFKQKKHEFQFGCNAFMFNQFPEAEQNAQYEEVFSDIFNLAVVPFYWADLEPEQGTQRFGSDSKPIYRRPPPDDVLDFCERKNITPKGHPLLWHCFRPDWLSHDQMEMKASITKRFKEISERYADRIKIWDVCNEAQTIAIDSFDHQIPDNHVELAFDLAQKYFSTCTKTYNDDRMWYHFSKNYSPVYLLVKSLLERGYKVDALGLQYHMFAGQLQYANKFMNTKYLFNCLDQYGKLGLPINFSEVSIISSRNLGDGDEFQRQVVEKLYKLWFSHAAVNGIIWWNMVDGTAAYAPIGSEEGENSLRAGLVNYDFSLKPAYKALHKLIKEDWQTDETLEYALGAENKFHGFYGEYDVEIETNSGKYHRELKLSKGSINHFKLEV